MDLGSLVGYNPRGQKESDTMSDFTFTSLNNQRNLLLRLVLGSCMMSRSSLQSTRTFFSLDCAGSLLLVRAFL